MLRYTELCFPFPLSKSREIKKKIKIWIHFSPCLQLWSRGSISSLTKWGHLSSLLEMPTNVWKHAGSFQTLLLGDGELFLGITYAHQRKHCMTGRIIAIKIFTSSYDDRAHIKWFLTQSGWRDSVRLFPLFFEKNATSFHSKRRHCFILNLWESQH